MLLATITVSDASQELEHLFSFEDKQFQSDRAKYVLKREKNNLVFVIEAKDSSALRSVLNTITKLLSVYEKTGAVLEKWEK